MAEYIDKAAAIKLLTIVGLVASALRRAVTECVRKIELMPAADVEPVRHGRWKPVFDAEVFRGDPEAAAADEITGYECSICGRTCAFTDGNGEYILPDVCPGCWAKMDGGENHDD